MACRWKGPSLHNTISLPDATNREKYQFQGARTSFQQLSPRLVLDVSFLLCPCPTLAFDATVNSKIARLACPPKQAWSSVICEAPVVSIQKTEPDAPSGLFLSSLTIPLQPEVTDTFLTYCGQSGSTRGILAQCLP